MLYLCVNFDVYDSAWKSIQVHILTFLYNCDLISFLHASFEITLAYVGIYNQPINCHIFFYLVSRDLFRA